jgi:uncharacterized protein (DUF433 family)
MHPALYSDGESKVKFNKRTLNGRGALQFLTILFGAKALTLSAKAQSSQSPRQRLGFLRVAAHPRVFTPRLEHRGPPLYDGFMKKSLVHHCDPDILGGTPVFVGTRVPIQSLFDHLEAGESIDDFLEGFPSVRRGQIIALLEGFKRQILHPA